VHPIYCLRLYQYISVNICFTERLQNKWRSPIYAFFRNEVNIVSVDGRSAHEFICSATHCTGKGGNPQIVRRFLDTSDKKSTGNLRRHTIKCWGEKVVKDADECRDVKLTRDGLKKSTLKNGSITAVFECKGKDKITYSHTAHSKTETR
jgi:hypothetical protein